MLPRLEYSGAVTAYCILDLLGLSDPPTSAFLVARTTGACHHALLAYLFIYLLRWVSNSGFKWSSWLSLPNCWGYRRESLHLAFYKMFNFILNSYWMPVTLTTPKHFEVLLEMIQLFSFVFWFFFETESCSAVAQSRPTATSSASWVQAIFLPQPPE